MENINGIVINNYSVLTNDYVLAISDELFNQTIAYKAWGNKQRFIDKMHDFAIRFKQLKPIITLQP